MRGGMLQTSITPQTTPAVGEQAAASAGGGGGGGDTTVLEQPAGVGEEQSTGVHMVAEGATAALLAAIRSYGVRRENVRLNIGR